MLLGDPELNRKTENLERLGFHPGHSGVKRNLCGQNRYLKKKKTF